MIPSPTAKNEVSAKYAYDLELKGDAFLTIDERKWLDERRRFLAAAEIRKANIPHWLNSVMDDGEHSYFYVCPQHAKEYALETSDTCVGGCVCHVEGCDNETSLVHYLYDHRPEVIDDRKSKILEVTILDPAAVEALQDPKPAVEYVYRDGTAFPAGYCASPDHYEATFTVKVRSLRPLSAQGLKNLIEGRHEVTAIEKTAERCVVQNGK